MGLSRRVVEHVSFMQGDEADRHMSRFLDSGWLRPRASRRVVREVVGECDYSTGEYSVFEFDGDYTEVHYRGETFILRWHWNHAWVAVERLIPRKELREMELPRCSARVRVQGKEIPCQHIARGDWYHDCPNYREHI